VPDDFVPFEMEIDADPEALAASIRAAMAAPLAEFRRDLDAAVARLHAAAQNPEGA